MGDISAITAGRAAALRNETRFQRNQQQQTRVRQDEERRIDAERQSRAVQDQVAARNRRAQDDTDTRRQLDIERRNLDLGARAVEDGIRNRRADARQFDSDNALNDARARDAEAGLPRLNPRTPVTDISEGRFREDTPPLGPPPEPVTGARTAEDLELSAQGPLPAFDPLPDLGPPAPFPAPEDALAAAPVDLQLQERERLTRVSDRAEDARTLDTEQDAQVQLADQRLARTTQANPDLPRGSIVNMLG